METDGWPPRAGDYFPRRILLRLESLRDVTRVLSAGWTDNVAEVTVWPYNDDIATAVRERLAALATPSGRRSSFPGAIRRVPSESSADEHDDESALGQSRRGEAPHHR